MQLRDAARFFDMHLGREVDRELHGKIKLLRDMQIVFYPVSSFPVLGPKCDLTHRLLSGLLVENRTRREWRRVQMQRDRGIHRAWIFDTV